VPVALGVTDDALVVLPEVALDDELLLAESPVALPDEASVLPADEVVSLDDDVVSLQLSSVLLSPS
jgi:hypothetical protein